MTISELGVIFEEVNKLQIKYQANSYKFPCYMWRGEVGRCAHLAAVIEKIPFPQQMLDNLLEQAIDNYHLQYG